MPKSEETRRPSVRTLERRGRKVVEKTATKLQKLKVDYVPIGTIHPNKYNPNRQSDHDFELLMRSIEEDGFTQPVLVQAMTRTIVDGEHRWRAAAELGMTEIPAVFVDMTVEQMRISTLRHNRARGSEDIELSAQVLRDLRELGALDWAMDSLILDDEEVTMLLDDIPAPEILSSEEFSEAWEPSESIDADGRGDGTYSSSMTPAAIAQVRQIEKKVQEARTEEERVMARRDSNIYRISLAFTGDEIEIVKRAVGDNPSEAVLVMCRERVGYATMG